MHKNQVFGIRVGDMIPSTTTNYEVQCFLGSGTFGVVTQCMNLSTRELMALKITKDESHSENPQQEAIILSLMKESGSDWSNIIRWDGSFMYKGHYCLEFEKLDISLDEFLRKSQDRSLPLMQIRPIVQQLATGLNFLKSLGIVHADLKPANIMMVDHVQQPLRVKIIDFGLAFNNCEEWRGATLQTLWYRSPEILLGTPFSGAIDMWSLGCIAAEMLMGETLFPGFDEYDMMRHIIYTAGKPPDQMLNDGMYTRHFFRSKHLEANPPPWIFMSIVEMKHFFCTPCMINSLDDLMTVSHKLSGEEVEKCDCACFINLLKQMLTVDPFQRITPEQCLQHSFITMTHLTKTSNSFYMKSCVELMDIRQNKNPEACQNETSSNTASPTQSSTEENVLEKKRDRDADDEAECGNSSDTSAKRRRTDCGADVPTETGKEKYQTSSPLLKRKREDADTASEDSSPKKKRTFSDSAIEVFNNSVVTLSISTPTDHLRKRQRDEDDAPGSNEISPGKKKKKSLDGEA